MLIYVRKMNCSKKIKIKENNLDDKCTENVFIIFFFQKNDKIKNENDKKQAINIHNK